MKDDGRARVDINEIAKIAGVSPSTVSKVVNHKDASISEQTRKRVRSVVREYHYTPYARNRASRDWLIATMLRSHVSGDSTLDGILAEAQRHGYSSLVYENEEDLETEKKSLLAIVNSGASGIIWEPVGPESLSLMPELDECGAKVITIGPSGGDEKSLLIPYADAARFLTTELIRRGHANIACLSRAGRRTSKFIDGYRQCLLENGIPFQEALLFDGLSDQLFDKIASGEVTGIVCSHYQLARAFADQLATIRYSMPDDVSLVSLRNDTENPWTTSGNAISTLTVRNADFGRLACRHLIAAIEGTPDEEPFEQEIALDNETSLDEPSKHRVKRVVVVGSIHMDTRLSVPAFPDAGMAVSSDRSAYYLGGKGVNEAIGVAKLGHQSVLIGNIGSDASSDSIYRKLSSWGVDTSGVHRKIGEETGKAFVFVNPQGESLITIFSGANKTLTARDIKKRETLFDGARLCLVQTEIPLEAALEACLAAHRHGVKTILKPASVSDLPDEIIAEADYLVPNCSELDAICRKKGDVVEETEELLGRGASNVIVTLGDKGCYLRTPSLRQRYEAAPFRTVDTTGAGDAFISALAACLLNGDGVELAVQKANYAGGYSTTRRGIASALIDRTTLEEEFGQGEYSG